MFLVPRMYTGGKSSPDLSTRDGQHIRSQRSRPAEPLTLRPSDAQEPGERFRVIVGSHPGACSRGLLVAQPNPLLELRSLGCTRPAASWPGRSIVLLAHADGSGSLWHRSGRMAIRV